MLLSDMTDGLRWAMPRLRVDLVAFLILATSGAAIPIAVAAPDHPPPPTAPESLVAALPEPYAPTDDYALADAAWTAQAHQIWLVADYDARADAAARAAAVVARYNEPAPTVEAPRPPPTKVGTFDPAIAEIIMNAALRHGLDPVLFSRIAWCESKGDPSAYNPSGASGLFQQLARYWPGRAAAVGLDGASPFDPDANAEVSATMMATVGTSPWNASRSCWA